MHQPYNFGVDFSPEEAALEKELRDKLPCLTKDILNAAMKIGKVEPESAIVIGYREASLLMLAILASVAREAHTVESVQAVLNMCLTRFQLDLEDLVLAIENEKGIEIDRSLVPCHLPRA